MHRRKHKYTNLGDQAEKSGPLIYSIPSFIHLFIHPICQPP